MDEALYSKIEDVSGNLTGACSSAYALNVLLERALSEDRGTRDAHGEVTLRFSRHLLDSLLFLVNENWTRIITERDNLDLILVEMSAALDAQELAKAA